MLTKTAEEQRKVTVAINTREKSWSGCQMMSLMQCYSHSLLRFVLHDWVGVVRNGGRVTLPGQPGRGRDIRTREKNWSGCQMMNLMRCYSHSLLRFVLYDCGGVVSWWGKGCMSLFHIKSMHQKCDFLKMGQSGQGKLWKTILCLISRTTVTSQSFSRWDKVYSSYWLTPRE